MVINLVARHCGSHQFGMDLVPSQFAVAGSSDVPRSAVPWQLLRALYSADSISVGGSTGNRVCNYIASDKRSRPLLLWAGTSDLRGHPSHGPQSLGLDYANVFFCHIRCRAYTRPCCQYPHQSVCIPVLLTSVGE